ncbi:transposase [Nonomuraea insulae]|uniref:Transposase n=1 Tax=Nonomuraea insulae TaxID=1616787 RepID=A0ABW1CMX2_9ACTN
MTEARRSYPSDLSDARWRPIEPILTAWRAERRANALDIGRPPEHDLRTILDAVLYVARTGIPWRYLPHDYPPWQTVYDYFARWQDDGVLDRLAGLLPRAVRTAVGRTGGAAGSPVDPLPIGVAINRDQTELSDQSGMGGDN